MYSGRDGIIHVWTTLFSLWSIKMKKKTIKDQKNKGENVRFLVIEIFEKEMQIPLKSIILVVNE